MTFQSSRVRASRIADQPMTAPPRLRVPSATGDADIGSRERRRAIDDRRPWRRDGLVAQPLHRIALAFRQDARLDLVDAGFRGHRPVAGLSPAHTTMRRLFLRSFLKAACAADEFGSVNAGCGGPIKFDGRGARIVKI